VSAEREGFIRGLEAARRAVRRSQYTWDQPHGREDTAVRIAAECITKRIAKERKKVKP